MIVKLLTEHHLEFRSLKRDCRGSSEYTLVKNVTLLEITCHGSITLFDCHDPEDNYSNNRYTNLALIASKIWP